MMIRPKRFNHYLIGALWLMMAAGCATEEAKKKQLPARLDIHVEVGRDATNFSEPVPIYRAKPIMVNVQKNAILTEANITEARVVDVVGGFAVQVQFNQKGTWLLEEYTTQNHGKRFAVHCEFGENLSEKRWIAGPIISKTISDGIFVFTPDATREECLELVLGLNNIAREIRKRTF